MTKNVLIVGVGGQGSLLASRIIGAYFMEQGLEVKVSEVHGMSQRGGSVVTYVRGGACVASPLIPMGEADIIISFEQLEAARWTEYLRKDGVVITSEQKIEPMPVIIGAMKYPEDVVKTISDKGIKIYALDALSMANEAGNSKAANVAILGAVSKIFGGDEALWDKALAACVKPKLLELNRKAFQLGRMAV